MLMIAALELNAANVIGNYGYCKGEVKRSTELDVQGANTVSAAICLQPEKLASLKGNQIVGVRVGIASRLNISRLTGWVRSSLDGSNLVEASVELTERGWIELSFANPLAIEGDAALYVGYTYEQESDARGISYADYPQAGSFYAKLGNDVDWADYSEAAAASIEAVVSGETLPEKELQLVEAVVTQKMPDDAGKLNFKYTVYNNGPTPITSFDVTTVIGDGISFTHHFDCQLALYEGVTFRVEETLQGETELNGKAISSTLTTINGGEDDYSPNNKLNAIPAYSKTLLVEESTNEGCSNCPRMATELHEALEKDEFDGRVAVITHHLNGFPDWLTISEEYLHQMEWFYNTTDENGRVMASFAPALMFNRYPYYNAIDDSGYSPFGDPGNAEGIVKMMETELDRPASTCLELSSSLDGNQLIVNVVGRRMNGFEGANFITVYLTEDNIQSVKQKDGTQPDHINYDFVHQYTARVFNSIYGEPVNWQGDAFTYSTSFTIDESWKKADMKVIAFVGNYDASDCANCVVDNCVYGDMTTLVNGIEEVSHKYKDATNTIYDMQGRRISAIPEGAAPNIYIINGKKIFK